MYNINDNELFNGKNRLIPIVSAHIILCGSLFSHTILSILIKLFSLFAFEDYTQFWLIATSELLFDESYSFESCFKQRISCHCYVYCWQYKTNLGKKLRFLLLWMLLFVLHLMILFAANFPFNTWLWLSYCWMNIDRQSERFDEQTFHFIELAFFVCFTSHLQFNSLFSMLYERKDVIKIL